MINKTPWGERIGNWSNKLFIGAGVCFGIWLLTQILLSFWKWSVLRFFNGVCGWLIAPVLIVAVLCWAASIALDSGNRGKSWAKRFVELAIKAGVVTVAVILLKVFLGVCMKYCTSGGFFFGLFSFLQSVFGMLVIPGIVVTLILLIASYASKRKDVADWLDSKLGESQSVAYGDIDELFRDL